LTGLGFAQVATSQCDAGRREVGKHEPWSPESFDNVPCRPDDDGRDPDLFAMPYDRGHQLSALLSSAADQSGSDRRVSVAAAIRQGCGDIEPWIREKIDMSNEFQYLFSPIKIGPVTLPNRTFSPPYATNLREDKARGMWDRLAAFHAERVRGGIGLVVQSEVSVHKSTANTQTTLDDWHTPHLAKVADAVHAEGGKIFQLIHNSGRQARPMYNHEAVRGPSPIRGPMTAEIPHEMDADDIREFLEAYRTHARIVKEAGFDGIEIQGSHGFMIASFLSPQSNHRKDEYGGSLENRMRFAQEVLEAVRDVIGDSMALGISLSIDELNPAGLQVPESLEICEGLDELGVLDYMTARIGDFGAIPVWIGDMRVPPGPSVHLSAEVKEVVDLPVMAVGRIKDPGHAELILSEGQADVVGFGRSTLCDPELVAKAREGRADEIRLCMSCVQGCVPLVLAGLPIECVLNPVAGLEREYGKGKVGRAETAKHVVIVGGGPAGLKAAETAAIRGHRVTLLEKANELGGQVVSASQLPGRGEFAESTTHLVGQVRRLGVDTRIGFEATAANVLALAPDAVIIATGSKPRPAALSGAGNVRVLLPVEILNGDHETGATVVVFDGGESSQKVIGITELMGQQEKTVTLVTPRLFAGFDVPPTTIAPIYQRFAALGVTVEPHTLVTAITDEGVVLTDVFSRQSRTVAGVDTLIWSGDNEVEIDLYYALKEQLAEIYRIGDCFAPRKIDSAIREGYFTALEL
jgi:2,4-dienoyl-CoA reductase-like NADH-dependent reductase (Old Yellow Enzyme family)